MFFIRPPCAVRTAKSSFIFSFRLFFLRRVCYNDFRLVEKVPFCRFAAVCFCSLLPSHPARGRRIIFYSSQFNAWPHLLHPARGRRTKHIVIEVKKQIARGHRRLPRFTAHFCAVKRGSCSFCEISGGSRYFSGLFPTEGNSAGFL